MVTITKIRLELADWLYNAGIVGVANILTANDIKYEIGKNYIEFNAEALEQFEEKYFQFFIQKYLKFTSWYRMISFIDYIDNFDEKEFKEQDIEDINKQIEYMKIKLNLPSYKNGYKIIDDKQEDLLQKQKSLKKIKMNKKETLQNALSKVKEQLNIMKDILRYLQQDEVKKIILAKNIMYDIITYFWKDVSFFHNQASTKDMYTEYKKYFLEPVEKYLAEETDKFKLSCFACDRKIDKSSSYGLAWLKSVGVDMSRKTSHFWNFYGDTYICPICNLVYSCIPAGFTVIRDKGLFVNQNSDMNTLIKINGMTVDHNTRFEELEDKSYFAVIDNLKQSEIENIQKEIDNIQIVKLDSANDGRPYTFNILSKEKLILISKNRKTLRSLVEARAKAGKNEFINLYQQVIQRLYQNKNQFDLINKLLKLNLDEEFKRLGYVRTIIKINNSFLGGIMKGKAISYDKIDQIQQMGFRLRQTYTEKKAENKINGISYRLLNALKTKNTAKFMESLINAYMYLNKPIPTEFVDGLKDVDRFQTIGYSFLLGLQGESGIHNKKNDNKEDAANE